MTHINILKDKSKIRWEMAAFGGILQFHIVLHNSNCYCKFQFCSSYLIQTSSISAIPPPLIKIRKIKFCQVACH